MLACALAALALAPRALAPSGRAALSQRQEHTRLRRAPLLAEASAAADIDCDTDGNCNIPSERADAEEDRVRLKIDLLRLGASCNRGEAATDLDRDTARTLASSLEIINPTMDPTLSPLCAGTWELVFSDTQLFRSSPFFMAGRAVCKDGDEARRYDWFCDMHRAALAISSVGKVRQIVASDRVTSEFEVSAGAVPFLSDFVRPLSYSGGLPFRIEGAIVSSASIESNSGDAWNLLMDTVEVKGSNIPLLRQVLDSGVKLETRQLGSLLETVVPEYANPKPIFRTTYLDNELRISRDQDGKLFVYTRLSDSTEPTAYDDQLSDLGLSRLIDGITGLFML